MVLLPGNRKSRVTQKLSTRTYRIICSLYWMDYCCQSSCCSSYMCFYQTSLREKLSSLWTLTENGKRSTNIYSCRPAGRRPWAFSSARGSSWPLSAQAGPWARSSSNLWFIPRELIWLSSTWPVISQADSWHSASSWPSSSPTTEIKC